ncbi:hypothetical protein ABNP31_11805 [Pseudomonas asiatica]|nr:hypothetical protein [Pseudomonas shirazica]
MKLCFGWISLLVDRVHGADAAMRSAVKHFAKKLPRSQRDILFRMGSSPAPRELAGQLCQFLPF